MFELTQDIAREFLDYDPDTGALTWRPREAKWFANTGASKTWNKRFAGKPAFTASDARNYKMGTILGENQKAHRVIWLWFYGEWPDVIDHINGIPFDNRVANLRSVDTWSNCKNSSQRKDNTSGHTGVAWYAPRNKWRVQISKDKKNSHVGYYNTLESALQARKVAEIENGYHENHGRAA